MSQIVLNPNTGQPNTVNTDPLSQVQGGTGKAPSSTTHAATPPPVTSTGGVGGADQDIPALPLPSGPLSLEQLVQALNTQGRQQAVQQGLEAVNAKAAEIKELNDEKIAEVQSQLESLKKQQKLSPFLKAFKWIGMVIGAIASVATVVAGAITANPFLIAGGLVGVTMMVNSVVSEASGGKYSIAAAVGELAKACGASEEVAKWVGFGIELAITLIGVGLTLGGAIPTMMAKSVATAAKVTSMISTATSILGGVNSMAMGATQIASSVYGYQVARSQADMKELQAILERLQTALESDHDLVESIMEKFQDLLGSVREIVTDNANTQTAILTSATPSMA